MDRLDIKLEKEVHAVNLGHLESLRRWLYGSWCKSFILLSLWVPNADCFSYIPEGTDCELVIGLVRRVGLVGIRTLFFWLIERPQKTVFTVCTDRRLSKDAEKVKGLKIK